ncbi:MAG: hypothetical protein J5761_03805 [Paludibacteraceae bacterium]|nr:hypothetical protein [Paludibacteraceae bacterium]
MKVHIDKQVYQVLDEFYDASMKKHITLDLPTVLAKIDRLEAAMYDFASVAGMVNHKPYRKDWQAAGYKELYVEGFHFAYKLYSLPNGETVLYYHDAVHDTLNYNPEDK